MQQWKQAAWMLIPVTGMSMLSVLFVVLWQALGEHTSRINALQQQLNDVDQRLQENPALSVELLGQQLKQVQSNQRELEDRISLTARQQSELLRLERNLRQSTQTPDSIEISPTAPFTPIP